MKALYTLLPYLFSTFFFFFPYCNSAEQANNEIIISNKIPSGSELRNALWKKKEITIVYPANEKYEAFFKERIQVLNENKYFGIKFKGLKSSAIEKNRLTEDIIFYIGTLSNNPLLKSVQEKLPIDLQEKGFGFDKNEYPNSKDIIKLFPYPNPLNPSLPLYLITGNNEEAILHFLENKYSKDWSNMFWSSWGYELYQKEQLKIAGYFNNENWELDKRTHFDFKSVQDTLLETKHFYFISNQANIEENLVKAISNSCETTLNNIIEFIGKSSKLSKIKYHFYPSVEHKGLKRRNMQEASVNYESNRIDVVTNEHFKGSQLHQENKLVLRKILKQPKIYALEEGLSNYFTSNWQKKGYKYWTKKMYDSNNLPPLEELLNNDFFEKESYLVMGAMSGVFIDFLIKKFGKNHFLKNYTKWEIADLLTLNEDWKVYLAKEMNLIVNSAPPINAKPMDYLQGFNYAHEGYRVFNGYGSKLSKESLGRLKDIGSNAVAIIPYSYMRNPNKPTYISMYNNEGGENDQAVLFAHYEAQKKRMHSMLKPQMWLGRSWPGDVDMKNEADWAAFFDYYYRWVRHYALLAEINGFDSFCIGVEFAKATLAREKDWRALIQKIRGLYSGQLTYAAKWGEEFENLQFWDELDFIGLNCYYPLSKKDKPSKRELKRAFYDITKKIERIHAKFNKPIVFTEIGFRSVDGTWKNPHADADGRSFNDDSQKLCYEVVFEGIQNKKWCKGILWWKWPCYLSYQGQQNTSFSPNLKQTENVIEKHFKTKLKN